MASRMENWEVGDFCRHFLMEAKKSDVELFKEKFKALGHALESLDAEFMRETSKCGHDLGGLIDDLHSLAGRLGYCETDRGFKGGCSKLYQDIDAAIEKTTDLDGRCFI